MYLDFYGLKRKPFALSPDRTFLYLTPGHREALAQLLYGVREGAGFIALTGDVGTGKTTLIDALRGELDGTAAVSLVFHSTLSFDGLLEYVLEDLGIGREATSRAQRLLALNNFLIECWRAGRSMLLILDEAHNLDPGTLEEVRLLSNFETSSGKLLQVLLVGQPELNAKLDQPGLRQFKQRVAVRATIRPLTPWETGRYILTRLRLAGARDLDVFSEDGVRRIAAYTRGVPRRVNIVCDHCLLFGYADQRRRIDRETVDGVIRYLEATNSRPRRRMRGRSRRRWAWETAAVAAVLIGAAVLLAVWSESIMQIGGMAGTRLLELARVAREGFPR